MNELFHDALMLPPQASSMARDIDTLHYIVIGTAFAVATIAMLWFAIAMFRFRDRGAATTKGRRIVLTTRRDLVLAGASFAIFLVFWIVGFSQYRRLREPPSGAMRIYVVAKQWMWAAVYPDGSATEDDIRVPVGQPVGFLMTSRDVIHSFYVGAFRLKQDVLPGRTTIVWFTAVAPGSYDILCAEYCGTGHSRMRGHVIAMEPDAFARWLAGHDAPDLVHTGERLAAEKGCLRCHTVDAAGTPHLGPTWRGLYGSTVPLATGETTVADEAYLTESMMDPTAKMHAGFPAIMPSYQGYLTAPEAASIVEYIRSLRGAAP